MVLMPNMELRWADWKGSKVLAVINHSDDQVITTPLPWMTSQAASCDIRWPIGVTCFPDNTFTFGLEAVGRFVIEHSGQQTFTLQVCLW